VPSYRYIKSRYKRLYIKKELFEKLQTLADREGLTVPSLIEKLYSIYITHNIRDNIQHNITPNTAQVRTVVKCYEKSKMKYPVESNIAYFRSKGLLVDWWEEGDDKVCFELKVDADSGAGQHHKKYYGKRADAEDDSWLLQYAPDEGEAIGE